jgi:hypothetical protein
MGKILSDLFSHRLPSTPACGTVQEPEGNPLKKIFLPVSTDPDAKKPAMNPVTPSAKGSMKYGTPFSFRPGIVSNNVTKSDSMKILYSLYRETEKNNVRNRQCRRASAIAHRDCLKTEV